MKYRNREIVDAIQFDGTNGEECGLQPYSVAPGDERWVLAFRNQSTVHTVHPTYWVVSYPDGTKWTLPDDAFRRRYELIE